MAYYLHLINLHKHCWSPHLLKLLMESLVFSHLSYALSVWGAWLNQQLRQHLECSQNRTVRLCKNLSRLDHVSGHYRSLRWLPFQHLIQFWSVGMMYHQYHHSRGIPLSPPIKFGHCQSVQDTRVFDHFANPERFCLRYSQSFVQLVELYTIFTCYT